MPLSTSNKPEEISIYFSSNCFRASSSESENSLTLFWRHADNFLFFLLAVIDPDGISLFFNENTSKVNIDNSTFRHSYISKHLVIVIYFFTTFIFIFIIEKRKNEIAKRAKRVKLHCIHMTKYFVAITIIFSNSFNNIRNSYAIMLRGKAMTNVQYDLNYVQI